MTIFNGYKQRGDIRACVGASDGAAASSLFYVDTGTRRVIFSSVYSFLSDWLQCFSCCCCATDWVSFTAHEK